MYSMIAKRVLATIPVMAVVSVAVFLMLRLSPGDPALIIAGEDANAESIERVRIALGLNRSLLEQFWIWAGDLLQGDLGTSIFTRIPVAELIAQRVEPTLSLTVVTIVLSVVVAVPLGTIAGATAGSWLDRTVMSVSVLGFSLPLFVLGYCLIFLFSLQLDVLPVQGFISISEGLWPFLGHMLLPATTLGLSYAVLIARITRANVLETMGEDYIRTARAKGVKERIVVTRHALRNSSIPVLTVIGLGLANLISGVVIVETVFNVPGIGRLVVDAILKRDYPVIQGVILVLSGVYVLVNLTIDLCYFLLDPRVRS